MANKLRAETNGCVVWRCLFLEEGWNCNGYRLLPVGNSAIISNSLAVPGKKQVGHSSCN